MKWVLAHKSSELNLEDDPASFKQRPSESTTGAGAWDSAAKFIMFTFLWSNSEGARFIHFICMIATNSFQKIILWVSDTDYENKPSVRLGWILASLNKWLVMSG
jgi:hypothetical protein